MTGATQVVLLACTPTILDDVSEIVAWTLDHIPTVQRQKSNFMAVRNSTRE